MNGVNPGLISGIRGPIVMITIGVLFLLDKFTPLQFAATWPVILIVLGMMALAGGSRRSRPGVPGVPLNGPADYPVNVPPQGNNPAYNPSGYYASPYKGSPSNPGAYNPSAQNPNVPPPGVRR